ncbi:MAG: DUF3108 domain-containing protein [Sphingobacteriales bacterium]|nr:DUF3108 domain-containing protein [Sphingobacteriales bacterium]
MTNLLKSICLIILFCSFYQTPATDICGLKNTTFSSGESLTMKVYYNTMGMYIGAGEATFSAALERFNGKDVYHCVGEGKTYSFFDGVFKVRDRYETYIDTANMLPLKFVRNVSEGGMTIYNNVTFNHSAGTAVSTHGVFKTPTCVQDVVSAIYCARNIDFNKYQPNDKIPFDMFLDDEIYHMYIRYIGRENIKTKYGKFHAFKFKPLLLKGTIFNEGEKMTAWVSDDPNHVLLRIESPIVVGTIKVDMVGYKNLRYPLTSLISK